MAKTITLRGYKMKAIIFVCSAIILYALQNIILEQKLSKFSTVGILFYCYIIMLPLTLIFFGVLKHSGKEIIMPSGSAIPIVFVVGIVYFFADYCFVSAYTSGGNLFTITTIVTTLPIVASAIRFFWIGGLPNLYQLAAYVFTFAAIYLFIKGS